MKLEYIPDSELDKLPRVTSEVIIRNKRFHPEGLFSEQIFGPVQSYKCWCKQRDPSIGPGQRCPKCGILITTSSMRRSQFAVIEVERLINPVAIELINFAGKNLKQIVSKILNMRLVVYKPPTNNNSDKSIHLVPLDPRTFEIDKDTLRSLGEENPPKDRILYGLDAIYELVCDICEKNKGKSLILNRLRQMIIDNEFFTRFVVVIPPDLRPCAIAGNEIFPGTLNRLYQSILVKAKKDITLVGPLKHLYECRLQQLANQLNKFVFEAGKKTGLIRHNMSGKRVDFSGRAVITVDPEIPLSHVKVSRLILLQLWKLEIARRLLDEGRFVTFKMAFDYLQQIYDQGEIPDDIAKIIDEVATDQFVIINRQPTLHRGSMFAVKVLPRDGYVIGLHPLVCPPTNADFDGDSCLCRLDIRFRIFPKSCRTNRIKIKTLVEGG